MSIRYRASCEDDLADLVTLRIAAMREGLEAIGRFDPERIERLMREAYVPEKTKLILKHNKVVGFYSLLPREDHLYLHHFYIHPDYQSVGIGATALAEVIASAEALRLPIRLRALKVSRSNEFYQRHGFVETSHDELDVFYQRDYLSPYLAVTDVIDWDQPEITALASELREEEIQETAKACFEWVRDAVDHSGDLGLAGNSCTASEVLRSKNGWCFAKSHLLAALLRANGIAAGFCYQRLRMDGGGQFTLHGLNAIYLPRHGWYRVDARGNKSGVDARFTPPVEQLAWPVENDGERDFLEIFTDPLEDVRSWLMSNASHAQAVSTLPDLKFLSVEG